MTRTPTGSYRLQYLDWLRGLGAIIMLQGHVFDSFLKTDLRQGGAFLLSQFVGGVPPAIFLFLTGVTLAFLMDSSERKGMAAAKRVATSLRRAGYLFLLAFVFRLQLWLFARPAPWTDLFKVDILNCMGFSIAAVSLMAAFRTAERVKLCAVLGLAIAFSSPLISQMDWSRVPWMMRNYIVPEYTTFGLFPWAAYLAFGVSAGSAIRIIPQDGLERAMQWAALAGGALILTCQYFSAQSWSLYAKSEYWLNSPAQVLTKLGVTLLILAAAFVWTRYAAGDGWSWVRQLGTTSLLVYWVHIELVYGRWFWYFKTNLMLWETVLCAAVVMVLMLGLSLIQTNRDRIRGMFAEMRWRLSPRTTGGAEGG